MYNWIAAGATMLAASGVCCYIKYEKRQGEYYELQQVEGVKVGLQNKRLYLMKPGYKEYNNVLSVDGYDCCLNLDMLGSGNSSVRHNGLMFCYDEKESLRRHTYDKSKVPTYLFGDSGGYKLATGTMEFIDPIDLAHWYNKYVKQGMTLDIPIWNDKSCDYAKHAGVQKKNTNLILENLDDTVTLYNISHGFNEVQRRKYIDIVYDDRLEKWAIGSTYFGNPFDFINNLFITIQHTNLKTFHVFGIANVLLIPILAWIGRYYEVTSDSSTHVQSAKNLVMFQLQNFSLKKLRVGQKDCGILRGHNEYPNIPCSCGICSSLSNLELYSKSHSSITPFLFLCMHNINCMAEYSRLWDDLAQNVTLQQYKELYYKIVPSSEKRMWGNTFNYIEDIISLGIQKANKLYSSYLSSLLGSNNIKGDPIYYSVLENDRDSLNYYLNKDNEEEYSDETVLDRYLQYYNDLDNLSDDNNEQLILDIMYKCIVKMFSEISTKNKERKQYLILKELVKQIFYLFDMEEEFNDKAFDAMIKRCKSKSNEHLLYKKKEELRKLDKGIKGMTKQKKKKIRK